MDFMLYSTFVFCDGRIIPTVRLPRDFKKRVPVFYKQGRTVEVIDYSDKLAEHMGYCGLGLEGRFDSKEDLNWDDKKGLVMIKVRPSGALDLNDRDGWPGFAEHNLGGRAAFLTGAVAMKYVSELMKSNPESTA